MSNSHLSLFGKPSPKSEKNIEYKMPKYTITPKRVKNLDYCPDKSNVGMYPQEVELCPLELRPLMKKSDSSIDITCDNPKECPRRQKVPRLIRQETKPNNDNFGSSTDVCRNILGPTPDESILAGLQTVIDLCGLIDTCKSTNDCRNHLYTIEDMEESETSSSSDSDNLCTSSYAHTCCVASENFDYSPYQQETYENVMLPTPSPSDTGSCNNIYESLMVDSLQSPNTPVSCSTLKSANTPVSSNTPKSANTPVASNTPKSANTPTSSNTPNPSITATCPNPATCPNSAKRPGSYQSIENEGDETFRTAIDTTQPPQPDVTNNQEDCTSKLNDKTKHKNKSRKRSPNQQTKSEPKDSSEIDKKPFCAPRKKHQIKTESRTSSRVRIKPAEATKSESAESRNKPKKSKSDIAEVERHTSSENTLAKDDRTSNSCSSSCNKEISDQSTSPSDSLRKLFSVSSLEACGVDQCCGKSSNSITCMKIPTKKGKHVCVQYKCSSANSSLTPKCFPPLEIPPCDLSCRQCFITTTDIKRDELDIPKYVKCDCIKKLVADVPKDEIKDEPPSSPPSRKRVSLTGQSDTRSSHRSVVQEPQPKVATFDPNFTCNKDYQFPTERKQKDFRSSRQTIPPVVQPVVGVCTDSKCGATGARLQQVRYAIVKISLFHDYTTYEIMKSSTTKPKKIPNRVEGIFVTKR